MGVDGTGFVAKNASYFIKMHLTRGTLVVPFSFFYNRLSRTHYGKGEKA